MSNKGAKNPNWRGGKTISSHGYILIRVGCEHHLADIRGYAYEHRIMAEKKLGRKLRKGEIVHHINNNRQDNRLENLKVVGQLSQHLVLHRNAKSRLRLPNEENKMVLCACKCGASFLKYDAVGRPRKYKSGHNPHIAKTQQEILSILEQGPMHRNRIAKLCEKPISNIASTLNRLKNKGLVKQIGKGVWALKLK